MGNGSPNFFNNVQLLVSCSDGSVGGIQIYGNTIDGPAHTLGLIPKRPSHPHQSRLCPSQGHDPAVLHDQDGGVAFNGLTELYSADNHFDHNVYRVRKRAGAYWTWNDEVLT